MDNLHPSAALPFSLYLETKSNIFYLWMEGFILRITIPLSTLTLSLFFCPEQR
jgi:hypothetical protein